MVQNTNEQFDNHQFVVRRDGYLDEEFHDALDAQERREALKEALRDTVHGALLRTGLMARRAAIVAIDNIDELLVGKREVE